ncbi:MAG: ATP-binding cassette domain-containing protein, partial [Minwuiales bacterium]|nr:ATP-binding cassette domain-containing protein [Minwuiales bacterium]
MTVQTAPAPTESESETAPIAEAGDTAVEVVGLSKNYGAVQALKSVDLTIESGEYFVLLGPSGGGKSTLLRLIGGFIKPTDGQI